MIVWSKGLGKKSLPMELDKANLTIGSDHLAMDGLIEPVYWQYTMKLYPKDLGDFMKLLAHPKTARLMAQETGILLSFAARLAAFVPKLSWSLLAARTVGKLRRKD